MDWYVADCLKTNTFKKNGETFFNQWKDIEENMIESGQANTGKPRTIILNGEKFC
jgi:endonuclease YncB( thermonuclease family)